MKRTEPPWSARQRRRLWSALALALLCGLAYLWATPFIWMTVASFRPDSFGGLDMASLWPDTDFTLDNFVLAWESGDFPLWYANSLIFVTGTLAVQLVTISLAGYAFARLRFPFRNTLFYLFLLQLMLVPPVLIVPNLTTLVRLGLYDTLVGVMAPYFASAFGTLRRRNG